MRYLFLTAVLTTLIAGCQPGNVQNTGKKIDYSKIAGTWKAEDAPWQVMISKEGKVMSAVHALGAALVKPNEITYITMKDDSKSSYTGGDFTLIYEPAKREMEVTINLESIHIRFLDNKLDGSNQTIIGGVISEDYTTWDAEVIEVFDYGPRFPQEEGDIYPKSVKFNKISN